MPGEPGENSLGPQDSPVLHEDERQSITGYAVSLPERLVRTTAASGGGLLLEAADHILPPPVGSARIYQCLIARPLRITVEAIGGVSGRFPEDSASGLELIKRKVAGNVMEAASVFTVGFSPLWFLAVASDITGGTRVYLDTFVKELKRAGVLPRDTDISSIDDLIAVMDRTVSQTADAIDIPPTAIADMRDSVNLLRENAGLIPGPQRLAEVFSQTESRSGGTETFPPCRIDAGGSRCDSGWPAPGERAHHRLLCGGVDRHSQRRSIAIPGPHQPTIC